jgi:hypothetical protein
MMRPAVVVLVTLALVQLAAGTPTPADCAVCKLIVDRAAAVGGNGTDLNKTIAVLQHDCAELFPKNGTLADACEGISKDLVDVLPFLDKQGHSLAWDSGAVCAAAGRCTVHCCLSTTLPEQVALSLTRDTSEMRVTWVTAPAAPRQEIQWGPTASALTFSATSSNRTYTEAGWIGVVHTAVIINLSPGAKIYYRVGNKETKELSPTFTFSTFAAGIGTSAQPLKFASVGDMGYGPNSDETIATLSKLAKAGSFHGIIHNGDISYADGEMTHWDDFGRKIEGISSTVPYLTSPGNHEIWYNFSAYKTRFGRSMPMTDEIAAMDGMYYSLDIGTNFHLVSMNTEAEIDVAKMSSDQLRWLDADLKANLDLQQHRRLKSSQAVSSTLPSHRLHLRSSRRLNDKNSTAWVAAFGHRPFYCSNKGGNDIPQGNQVLRAAAEDILLRGKVDLVVQAHVHDYERSWPIMKGEPTAHNYEKPAAPVYVVNGAAGNRENNDHPPGKEPWEPEADPAAGVRPYAHAVSFGIMSIEGDSLRWTQFYANGTQLDEFVITK